MATSPRDHVAMETRVHGLYIGGQKLLYVSCIYTLLQVLYISDVVNRPEYIPRNPTFENLPNVFDVRFSQVQPYLHRVSSSLASLAPSHVTWAVSFAMQVTFELAGESVAGAMRKLLHTFAY